MPQRYHDHHEYRERQVDEEDRAPTPLDQEAAEERTRPRRPTPPRPDHAPIAAARSRPWNDAEISARLPGVSGAPPDALQRPGGDQHPDIRGKATAAEARANQTTPIRNIRRRPKRSPSDPPSRISAAKVSV